MTTDLKPYRSASRGLRALLRTYGGIGDPRQVGGSLPGAVDELYIRMAQIPGGSGGLHQRDFTFDVETFHPNYHEAESAAFNIEALLLGYSGMVEVPGKDPVRIDRIRGGSPAPTYWDDAKVTRFLGTYVITVRR